MIAIYAGTGLHDLTEIKTLELHQPRGWMTVDVGEFGRGYSLVLSHIDIVVLLKLSLCKL
jgi:Anaphase-promoting complex, subunit 10 (APC10)